MTRTFPTAPGFVASVEFEILLMDEPFDSPYVEGVFITDNPGTFWDCTQEWGRYLRENDADVLKDFTASALVPAQETNR